MHYKEYGIAALAPVSLRLEQNAAVVALTRDRDIGEATLTLPGAWKLATPVKGVTLTKTETGYRLAVAGLVGTVRLVKE